MTKKQLESIKHEVEWEGFDYVFSGSYRSYDEIKDNDFHKLYKAYRDAGNALREYLGIDDDA